MNKIKNFLLVALVLFVSVSGALAQDKKEKENGPYTFTDVKVLPTTSIKNQNRSGTCWSFSGVAFLESELLRMGKPSIDLSPMYVVRNIYAMKADRYVRFNGKNNFGPGGSFFDVLEAVKRFGIVPMDVYPGLNYGEDSHVHGELDAVTKAFVDAIIENPNRKLSTAWKNAFNGILDAYLGANPKSFTYNGNTYTPAEFAKFLGINPDDYVVITSFSHHPFYEKFVMELPDNWIHGEAYNVPLNDFESIIDNAIDNDFPVAWASDVSEKGFSWRNGVAIVPDIDDVENAGSDKDRWTQLSVREKEKKIYSFEKPVKEMIITQELRQEAFDNYRTTDDHGMLLVGKAKDQLGNTFYKVKNSWGTNGKYNGYFYASKAFVLYKTTNIMVHKNAIPSKLRKKLGIK
ncbi:MAG: hypothetical protein PWR03_1917 [Tenuifilum sp.]|jgi:bleomycin hydrolase|uniref:Aminopeptidase n=1 Tax=Tenuifilum thalassicum TaxID=2590900 RepID=A0A7D3XUV2_9BACT|nr:MULTISPECIES: C1 family peptidase [Tenuifilum]MDI3527734.1 hypothetical protein [Tenuifilum sp.]QKG79731.1 aminopeptidase [Tenuifilum thalassicum]